MSFIMKCGECSVETELQSMLSQAVLGGCGRQRFTASLRPLALSALCGGAELAIVTSKLLQGRGSERTLFRAFSSICFAHSGTAKKGIVSRSGGIFEEPLGDVDLRNSAGSLWTLKELGFFTRVISWVRNSCPSMPVSFLQGFLGALA